MKNSIILSMLLFITSTAWAQTAYIHDTLFVPLRSGEGTGFRIIHKGLKSGSKLTILGQNTKTGYSNVKTETGLIGFLPSRYLSEEPIAKLKLASSNAKLKKLTAKFQQTDKELAELKESHKVLENQISQSKVKQNKTSKELVRIKSVSANALNLDKRNRELRETNEQLRSELEFFQTDNLRLKDKSNSKMMLMGGGLVTLGILISIILPMIRPSRKGDSWA